MNDRLRQSVIGLIWPGPFAGPLPINLLRILAPILVLYLHPPLAALLMALVSSALAVFFFGLLRLEYGKQFTEKLLNKLPKKFYEQIETKGPLVLFASSLVFGVFAYAVFMRVLKYKETNSEGLLVLSSFLNSFIWTGIFWGVIVESLRGLSNFAF